VTPRSQPPLPGLTVPLVTHPSAAAARKRGDLAERMVDVACELALTVRDQDRAGIGRYLSSLRLDEEEARALVIVLAAMVPAEDRSKQDMLAWVNFTEFDGPDGGEPADAGEEPEPVLSFRERRFLEYAELRGYNLPVDEAARRARVSKRTAERYEAELKREGADAA